MENITIKFSKKTKKFEKWKDFHMREIINAARLSEPHNNVIKFYDAYTWTEVKHYS